MIHKSINFILTLAFICLVALFAYKTISTPQIISKQISASSEETSNNFWSKKEIRHMVGEYIAEHPEEILKSLENIQKKKAQESAQKLSNYLSENKEAIEKENTPPVFGNPEGDISVVFFYDYNCSYCKKANQYNNLIIANDSGVKVILRPLPILGGTSTYAAKIILAVQRVSEEKFPEIHNELMKMSVINEDSVKTLLNQNDIDYKLVENEVNSYSLKQLITKNFDFAKNLDIQGAPSYVINGHIIPGLIPVEKFKDIIIQLRDEIKNEQNK